MKKEFQKFQQKLLNETKHLTKKIMFTKREQQNDVLIKMQDETAIGATFLKYVLKCVNEFNLSAYVSHTEENGLYICVY